MGDCSRTLQFFSISPIVFVPTLQIAAQIRKFAKSDENKLVLPGNISAGERSAARGFAVGEGLGCETRGDGTDRALHVWKVRITPSQYQQFVSF